jgi:hypothetical protein
MKYMYQSNPFPYNRISGMRIRRIPCAVRPRRILVRREKRHSVGGPPVADPHLPHSVCGGWPTPLAVWTRQKAIDKSVFYCMI